MLSAELNRERKLGVEYEMTVPLVGAGSGHDVQETLARVLTSNGLNAIARGYSHDLLPDGTDFAVEFDSSVTGESAFAGIQWVPIELKTRIVSYDEWERLVPKALEICSYMGARVNRSCGHHVHIALPEARRRPAVIRSLYNLVHRFEPVMFGLVSPSRQASGYCRPMPDRSRLLHRCRTLRCFKSALAHWQRYYGLNLVHVFDPQPHVELRYHNGTIEPEKARMWLRLCLQLVQHAVTRNCQAADKPVENTRKGFENFRYTLGLKSNIGIYAKVAPELKETGKHFLKRWKHFQERPAISGPLDTAPM